MTGQARTDTTAVSETPDFRLYAAGSDGIPSPQPDPDAMTRHLAGGAGEGLVIYVRPAACLAAALARGESLAEAQARWCAAAAAVMAVRRRYRDRVTIVEAPGTAEAKKAVRQAVGARGLTLTLPAGPDPDDGTGAETLCALSLGLDPDAAALVDALQAATTGPCSEPGDPAALIADLAAAWSATGATDERAEIERRLAEAEARETILKNQVLELEGALRNQAATTAQARAETERARTDGKAALDAVHASTSWRVTGPMRALKRMLSRG